MLQRRGPGGDVVRREFNNSRCADFPITFIHTRSSVHGNARGASTGIGRSYLLMNERDKGSPGETYGHVCWKSRDVATSRRSLLLSYFTVVGNATILLLIGGKSHDDFLFSTVHF